MELTASTEVMFTDEFDFLGCDVNEMKEENRSYYPIVLCRG